ncbi:NADPH:quinone oxidoreductase family protein [uncultured Paracoccus sp.]|uniref:NADPH:quinone oxidoreductase family protein n=1 Tax=uncultured Paracoccus sp. TaxID=189685 RepID=UPI00262DE602|nr:NADPH:quinone oxidoreductase family protein [uncultured Paracoccus sp.]
MKALLSTAPGGPETLTLADLPTPEPEPGQVRIKVAAAGVNFPDTLIIRDLYQMKPPRPFAPGGEVAGIVDVVGAGVQMPLGTRVLALTGSGGFATHVCVDALIAMPIPDAMPFDEAGAFLFTYGTSYYALHDLGQVGPGQTVLILGAAGGIGVSAIEIAKAAGARVVAAVSSEEKAAFCREIGADETVVYPREVEGRDAQKDLSALFKQAVGTAGADIVVDAVGGNYAEPALRAIAWKGRFLVVGFPAGIPRIPLNLPLLKNCSIVGVFWGAFTRTETARFADHVREMFALYEQGRLRPRISQTLPLDRAAEALTAIEDRSATGKIVILP